MLCCLDAVFTLKTLLQERREKGFDTWIAFIDQVKVCNSTLYDVTRKTFELLGAPIEIIEWAIKLHANFQVAVEIGREEVAIPYEYRVKQGDSIASILFICAI